MAKRPVKPAPKRPAARRAAPARKPAPAAVLAPERKEKRPMTPADKAKLQLYAGKIAQVSAWPESEDRTATLARLTAIHGELLDQVLAEPIVPDVLAGLDGVTPPENEPTPETPPTEALAHTPAPPAAPAEAAHPGVDFRGNPLL